MYVLQRLSGEAVPNKELRRDQRGYRRSESLSDSKSLLSRWGRPDYSTKKIASNCLVPEGIIYLGLESGDPEILKRIKKNATVEELIRAGKRVKESGILLSVTVILGLGGAERSRVHAVETGKVLSEMDPDYVGALSLMIVRGTPIEKEIEMGKLKLPTAFGLIQELEMMITNCQFSHCFFASNHASNYLPLRIQMPEQKEEALERIREVLRRRDPDLLRPEYLRAL
jgi:radical SAM superfamily enzyme YgiQ (UPF0313 family)